MNDELGSDDPCPCNNPDCPNNRSEEMSIRSPDVVTTNAMNHITNEMLKHNTTVHQINGSISQGLKTKLEENGFTVDVRLSSNDSIYTLISTGPLVKHE